MTSTELAEILGVTVFYAALALVVGIVLLWRIAGEDPARQKRGGIILAWTVGMILLSGGYQAHVNWQTGNPRSHYGGEGFGLLIGWAIGAIHGALVIRQTKPDRRIAAGYGDRFADRERRAADGGTGVQRGDAVSERSEECP